MADKEEVFWPECEEKYTEPPEEDWIICHVCKDWWHEACTSYEGMRNFNITEAQLINVFENMKRRVDACNANNCAWLGQWKNFHVCDLKSMLLIKDVFISNYNIKESEFELYASEWFHLSKLRLQREAREKHPVV
ncbi:hypothetical protein FQA39_LY00528 [Lamprigera yunnana]|nr:hypothetical protein FQA39_LY00528 [Lamprigera yunnana]